MTPASPNPAVAATVATVAGDANSLATSSPPATTGASLRCCAVMMSESGRKDCLPYFGLATVREETCGMLSVTASLSTLPTDRSGTGARLGAFVFGFTCGNGAG